MSEDGTVAANRHGERNCRAIRGCCCRAATAGFGSERVWSIISVTNGQSHSLNTPRKPSGGHPTALAEAADGTIWAGTLAGLLLHWDGKQFVPLEPPERSSLGRIWALWAAPDGSLWAGTEEGGLLHWNNGKFFRYTMKNGLPSDSVVQILGDGDGNLWLGTRAGIVRIPAAALAQFEAGELNQLPVSVYGRSDGLLTIGSAIIYQPNCWRGRDGTLFFAMANSVAMVNPEEVHINPPPPTVALEEMWADDKRVWPESVGAVLTAPETAEGRQAATPEIKVGPGRGRSGVSLHRIEPRFAGACPVQVPASKDWKAHGTKRAGKEKPAIATCRRAGMFFTSWPATAMQSGASDNALLAVTVKPFFYQTAWFRGGAGLLAVAGLSFAVAIAMRRRMRRRLEHLKRQHELERERSRIAQDLHDDLGAGLTEIGLLGGLLQDPSRFPTHKQEALDRIVHRCRDLVMALDEIVWAVNPRNDSVNSLGGYLCRYAQGFLEPTSIRCRLEVQESGTRPALEFGTAAQSFSGFQGSLDQRRKTFRGDRSPRQNFRRGEKPFVHQH